LRNKEISFHADWSWYRTNKKTACC